MPLGNPSSPVTLQINPKPVDKQSKANQYQQTNIDKWEKGVKVLPHKAKILTKSLVRHHIYKKKTIVTIAYVNDFVQGGRVELFSLVAFYRCILIG